MQISDDLQILLQFNLDSTKGRGTKGSQMDANALSRDLESAKAYSNLWLYISFPSAGHTCLSYWSCLFSRLHPSLHPECPLVGFSCSAHRGAGVDLRTTHILSAAGLSVFPQMWEDKGRSSPFQYTEKEPVYAFGGQGYQIQVPWRRNAKGWNTLIGLRHSFLHPLMSTNPRIVPTLYLSH